MRVILILAFFWVSISPIISCSQNAFLNLIRSFNRREQTQAALEDQDHDNSDGTISTVDLEEEESESEVEVISSDSSVSFSEE